MKANAPIEVVFVKPKLFARDTMKTGFTEKEAAVMAPFTPDRAWALDEGRGQPRICLLYTSPSPRDRTRSRMPSSA